EAKRPATYFQGMGFAAMGHGFAASIGAKAAAPNRPVIAIGGDGAFAMTGMELHTAVDNEIPVIWIVLNNSGHGMVYHGDRIMMNRTFESSSFKRPLDLAGMARAMGAGAFKVDSSAAFRKAFEEALKSNAPSLIDTVIDPEEVPVALHGRVKTLK